MDHDDDHSTAPLDGRLTPAETDLLAPFVAWMATQSLAEGIRREHRESVEAFLRWRRTDDGDPGGARLRYEELLPDGERAVARRGLGRFAEYRALRARTLPVEEPQ